MVIMMLLLIIPISMKGLNKIQLTDRLGSFLFTEMGCKLLSEVDLICLLVVSFVDNDQDKTRDGATKR